LEDILSLIWNTKILYFRKTYWVGMI
jgi:hypothetical protein